ncbi:putative ribonuclease H-like domain-containing protein [Tanacetum coccineum]
MLLMALPNEHLLTFSQYKDTKTLFEAIHAIFGSNEATKKTQKTLLKQIQLAILGENISQEDLNLKFLRSLPIEWNTHVVVWRNKLDLDMMSIVDLYNNFKIVEQEVKRSVTSSFDSSSQNVVFVSTPSSTKDANPASVQVSTVSTPVSTASTNSANLSDAIVYAFLANQPNGSQIFYEDLNQIHDDDLEEMDLKWNLALLSMRARKFYQRTRKKITIDRSDTAGSKKIVNVEDTSPTAIIAIDGTGFDWSFMTEEEAPTNMALMAIELNKSNFDLANYKRGLASVEEQLVFYKKNEVAFCDQIAILKRDASFKDSEINALKTQVENLKKEKENIKIKVYGFENASKSLDTLIGSQVSVNKKRGLGFDNYNVVAPPPTGLFAPLIVDLSNSGLKEFQQHEFSGYGVKVDKSVSEKSTNEIKKTPDAPIIEDCVSDCEEDESKHRENENVQTKPKQVNEPRKISETPRNNSINWNKSMSKKLVVGFQFGPKAYFVCGSFSHLIKDCDFHDKRMAQKPVLNNVNKGVNKGTGQREVRPVWNSAMRTNYQNFSNSRRNLVPIAVITKTSQVPISTAKAAVPGSTAKIINTACSKTFVNVAKIKPNVFQKPHSPSKRPFYQQTALKHRILNNKVNTARTNSVNSGKGKSVSNAVGVSGDPHVALKDIRIFDSGCSRHMIGNKSFLTDYQDHDGGFVAFAGSTKGGKITGTGRIKTEHLNFDDVYFVKELKFNLFSVSQMCDRNNSVLFTETECLILSPEFKPPDENQVMLKIPRKDNMYSFDLKNIVPSKGLTCLIAKATNDESNMWHRRLGHINFKTMNKLVKGNLVRGLPSKTFENNHTCVACQKGKQHKASYKTKLVNSISTPLQILHMDLFGPTFVKSLMGKMYCLVITDDYSRFSWVFFLAKKDETSSILKNFITGIENQLNHKVKVIRCDNGTEFKNNEMNQFCGIKGIKREFRNARTPQQNRVAERKNKTFIEAARTMLAAEANLGGWLLARRGSDPYGPLVRKNYLICQYKVRCDGDYISCTKGAIVGVGVTVVVVAAGVVVVIESSFVVKLSFVVT